MASRTPWGRRPAAAPTGSQPEGRRAARSSSIYRALSAHEHRTAAGLLALLVLVYLYPALLEGHLLAPLSGFYVNETVPWIGRAPTDLFTYINTGLEDVPLSYYPWDVLARRLIHAGTFPAWNPYALGGTPFFANPEVAWASPFSLPLWILPLHYGLGLAAALKLWVAGFGTYLLTRELKLGFWPALLAGVSFALCAFDIAWLSHGVQVSVAVMLPWSLWLVERLIRRGRAGEALALAGVVAIVLTSGHPGTQLHVLTATVLYALMRAALSTDVETRARLRRLGLVGAALALGTLLTAVVLLPAQQASLDTAGAFARSHGATEFLGSNMPVGVLRTALFPEWWGRLSELVLAGPAYFNERTFYAGTAALVLAAVALVCGGSAWRRMTPFVVLGVLGAAVAVKNPVHTLARGLPLFEQVQNQRMLLFSLLAVAVLAGFGLQAILDNPRRPRVWGVLGAALLAALVAIVGIGPHGKTVSQGLHYALHRSGADTLSAIAFASVVWWVVFVALLGAVLLFAWRRPRAHTLIGALVVLVAAIDMIHFSHGYQPMGPVSKAIPPRTPAIAYLERHAGDGRIAGLGKAFPADWPTLYSLRDAAGYDQPQPSLRFLRLWQAMEAAQTAGGPFRFEAISPASLRVLSVLGTRYVITGPSGKSHLAVFPRVYHGHDASIFANTASIGRAIVAGRVHVAGDDDAEVGAVMAEGFDPRREAVVRADELGSTALPGDGSGSVRVIEEHNSDVTLHATLPRQSLVVLDDAWAKGWSVRVDGHPARALRTDVVLRGVVVPAGSHAIVWSYRVPGLRLGLALSLLGLLIALGWGGWLVARARRGGGRPGR
jgi:hypothetical protein